MSDEVIDKLSDGRVVAIYSKNIDTQRVPLFCPCCEYPMRTMDDCVAYRKLRTCYHCSSRWSNTKGVVLLEGVFPDKSTEEWQEYLSFRQIVARNIFTL